MRIDDINKIAVQKLIDKNIFDQAILAMEEHYGSGCDTEIDAYFRGAKWMQEQEDMADKKYTEEDMRAAMICVIVSDSIKNSKDITEYITEINKQD